MRTKKTHHAGHLPGAGYFPDPPLKTRVVYCPRRRHTTSHGWCCVNHARSEACASAAASRVLCVKRGQRRRSALPRPSHATLSCLTFPPVFLPRLVTSSCQRLILHIFPEARLHFREHLSVLSNWTTYPHRPTPMAVAPGGRLDLQGVEGSSPPSAFDLECTPLLVSERQTLTLSPNLSPYFPKPSKV